MLAYTILTLFVKSTVSNCYCVHTAVSVSYSICYHMYNNEIVFTKAADQARKRITEQLNDPSCCSSILLPSGVS